MERFKKMRRKFNLNFLFKKEFKRKIIPLAVMVSLTAFSFVPMATSAPTQDDAAGYWEDSFSDDTGIDWEYSSDNLIVSGGKVKMGSTAESPDGKGWCIERVDDINTLWDVTTDLVFDSNNRPHIAYRNVTGTVAKYAYYNGTSWNTANLPNSGGGGRVIGASIALDSNNYPHIVFARQWVDKLEYVRWDGSNWVDLSIIASGNIVKFPSIDIYNDKPRIAYIANGKINYIEYNGASWRGKINPTDADVLYNCSNCDYSQCTGTDIEVDKVTGNVYIGFCTDGHSSCHYAKWNGVNWTEDSSKGGFSLKLDSSNDPYFTYAELNAQRNFYSKAPFAGESIDHVIHNPGDPWKFLYWSSLGLTSLNSEKPVVSYYRGENTKLDNRKKGVLKYAKGTNMFPSPHPPSWFLWDTEVVDSISVYKSGWAGQAISMKLDSNDNACISYVAPSEMRVACQGYCAHVVSEKITPGSLDNWDKFFANDTTPGGTTVTYSILASGITPSGEDSVGFIDGYRDITSAQASAGFDISGINATSYPSIRLMATFKADSPAPVPELQDWKVTWDVPPDVTPPTIDYLEAEYADTTLVSDGPDGITGTDDDGITISSLTDSVTIKSLASDDSGVIFNHQVSFAKDDVWEPPKDCGANFSCSVDICDTYTCPLPAGTVIKYKSQATDSAVPIPNTGYSPEKSFTVIDLSVTLSANPPSGSAPLDDVDLTASVGGSATGNIRYRFDCTDDGVWESDDTVAASPYTKVDLCDYTTAGTYTARVEVTRQGITATDTVDIIVNPPNNPPVMTSVTITPDPAYTNDDLTANPTATDADGDPITYSYQWIKNDVNIAGETNQTLLSGNFVKNDIIKVKVTPNDGTDDGSPMTSPPLTISNSAPTQPMVSITPSSPVETDNLTCNISVASTDADTGDTITYAYKWYKDSTFQAGETTNTINSGLTSIGETWECEATPNDGTIDGPVSNKASVVISDSSIIQAYAFNGTNDLYCSDCTIDLENISKDDEDCPDPGYPCLGHSGFSECVWDINGSDIYSCDGISVSSYDFGGEGTYTDGLGLTVTDQGGLSSSNSRSITFKKDIYADFECSLDNVVWEKCADISPEIDGDVYFRAVDGSNLSTPSDGVVLTSWEWDFNDDGVIDDNVVSASLVGGYTSAGDYPVSLIVTDSAGRRAGRSYTITVGAAEKNIPKNWKEIAPSL